MQSPETLFLRPDAKVELLAGRWYVWPHLLAPVQHAMNVTHRHLPMLHSFVANPAVHEAASRDPTLLGGAFLDLRAADVPAVQDLIARTLERYAKWIELANELTEFDQKLQKHARGFNLDELYVQLPPSLRGRVELVYDVNNHPSLCLREALFYEALEKRSGWNEICVYRVPDRERRMFISTPLLPAPDRVFIETDFADERIDLLSAARVTPQPFTLITEAFALDEAECAQLRRCFTTEAPVRTTVNCPDGQVRLRYFGHACVLAQTAEVSILLDPFCAYERDERLATLTLADLPDFIDYVVLSHGHHDHLCPEMLMQLRRRIGQVLVPAHCAGSIVDPSLKLILERLGLRNVREMRPFETVDVPGGVIRALPLPGEHCGLNVHAKQSVSVRLRDRTVLFLADSDAVDAHLYNCIARLIGHVDAVFLGMECHGAPLSWFYGPLLTRPLSRRDDESRRGNGCNCERAWNMIRELGSPPAIYVYAMGMEPWTRHLLGLEYASDSVQIQQSDQFLALCRAAGLRAERLQGCREIRL